MDARQFAAAAHDLGHLARTVGLRVPTFRSPPTTGERRTIRFRDDGAAVVAVRVDQPDRVVVDDMIEGLLAANGEAGVGRAARRFAAQARALMLDRLA